MRSKLEHPAFLAALGLTGLLIAAFSRAEPASMPAPDAGGSQNRPTRTGKPSSLPPRSWWSVIKGVASHVSSDRLLTEAAGVTFYTLLASRTTRPSCPSITTWSLARNGCRRLSMMLAT